MRKKFYDNYRDISKTLINHFDDSYVFAHVGNNAKELNPGYFEGILYSHAENGLLAYYWWYD